MTELPLKLNRETVKIALSFDDGYLGHLRLGKILSKLGVRATFYIVTGLKSFEGKTLLSGDPELIREIEKMGHEVGSHTVSHSCLVGLPCHKLENEVRDSKRYLENVLGVEVYGLAYPYGYFDEEVIAVVSKHYHYARAAAAYSTEDVWNINPPSKYALSALTIHHITRMPFKLAIEGNKIHPIVFAHNVHPLKVVGLVTTLRSMFNVEFVTVRDMVSELE